MSPTIFRYNKYRFFFNSNEENRIHVHIATSEGTAKFWLEPIVSLANYYNFSTKELKEAKQIVEEKQDEFIQRWNTYFNR
jgi:hypothetical protein